MLPHGLKNTVARKGQLKLRKHVHLWDMDFKCVAVHNSITHSHHVDMIIILRLPRFILIRWRLISLAERALVSVLFLFHHLSCPF